MHVRPALLAICAFGLTAISARAQVGTITIPNMPQAEARLLGKGDGYFVHLIQGQVQPVTTIITNSTLTNMNLSHVEILQYTNIKTGEAKVLEMRATSQMMMGSLVTSSGVLILGGNSTKALNAVADDRYVYILNINTTGPNAAGKYEAAVVLRALPLTKDNPRAEVTVMTVDPASLKADPQVELKDGTLAVGSDKFTLENGAFKKN